MPQSEVTKNEVLFSERLLIRYYMIVMIELMRLIVAPVDLYNFLFGKEIGQGGWRK